MHNKNHIGRQLTQKTSQTFSNTILHFSKINFIKSISNIFSDFPFLHIIFILLFSCFNRLQQIWEDILYLGILNASLAMSVTYQKFCFLSRHSQATSNIFFTAAHDSWSHKSVMHYSLFGNVSNAKIYPGILDISVSISIAHQSIDISEFHVCHFQ